ncbi:MAG: CDP-diacylglycerol--serine O-phosphatidyltransferase [Sphingobacteriales bacterium]|nr:CDP-diacylglycerol--serine O-phosphatidyltransferase [Sphingobacteriales bacterium]
MRQHIPNLLTLLNLMMGCLALYHIFKGDVQLSVIFIAIAAAADFADGFVARMLGVQSDLGKQLDSLADVVTFGVVPGAIIVWLLQNSPQLPAASLLPFAGFVISLFSALRLAKFNIDTRQTNSFLGVPTPANTLFFVGLLGLSWSNSALADYLLNPVVLLLLTALFSYLLVSEIPIPALKFKNFSFKDNRFAYGILLSSVLYLAIFGWFGLSLSIATYIITALFIPKKPTPAPATIPASEESTTVPPPKPNKKAAAKSALPKS